MRNSNSATPALVALSLLLGLAIGCGGAQAAMPRGDRASTGRADGIRTKAARAASAMVGTPYRTGGSSPRGFDCSGLVVFSYARAGVSGLPHSAATLERRARPIALREIEPGDLLFFRLGGKKTSHVGMYVGDRTFVHAPSSGKRVERVSFDHVYWGPRLDRAGRVLD